MVRLAFHENLPDERGDALDGVRYGEDAHQRQARVGQAGMSALTDGPDPVFAGHGGEGLHRIISHHVVKPAHQSLVRTEHDRIDKPRTWSSFAFYDRRGRHAFPEANAQSQLHAAIVVAQCAHRSLILADV